MTAPASLGYSMPAEWHPHERTWMAFPTDNPTFSSAEDLHAARLAWAKVADTIVRYEPVTLVVNVGEAEAARDYVSADVEIVERPLDDAWMRDIGPTFLLGPGGRLAAADWIFNGWGAQSWARWENDQHIAEEIIGLTGVQRFASRLINEGGGIHVDGEGTVLVTETVQLGEGRNADWTKEEVEAELHAHLGTTKAIWLPRGLTRDYDEFGTRGHIDIVASFARPGVVLAHVQPDPAHPDHTVCQDLVALLRASMDAAGRPLEVIEVPAPTVIHDADGEPVDYSYINHYVANGAVILCAFDDPRDQEAATILGKAYPGRTVELVDAREIFANGGGIHCITQQQPRA
ncbi:agmatine deiminase family protein [Kitasatospora acidiphila]|uniref:Agmatine deiminase family protein n=1 Tax=Kitasatospora acidiphila TaxID=2567942 RepID=A0A540WAN5_9ACTN|nr:agmatine deiminase family protein [Kitasatospora acidiphila]TQF05967.1 agmatine deiminase family protein [Kitasatospora acidiphila]